MNWKYLFKAVRFVLLVVLLVATATGILMTLIVYTPPLVFGILFIVGFFGFLIHTQYNHYKRMDEIEADHKKWAREMSDKWDRIK